MLCCCSGEGKLRSCVATLDTCRVTYQIDSLKLGTETDTSLYIYVETDSKSYNKVRAGEAIMM